ncbi:PAS domain-containing sensor histidine kinase [Chitinophaga niabensis]|uniref:PAS domain-containing sensor histidine kinase n=1 Tax=Chitinophaga niabensis TaxID=536979 RepID=UPI0031B9F47D
MNYSHVIDSNVLFNNATMGIIIADESGCILMANPFLLNEFGYSESEINGQKIEKLIPQRFHSQHQQLREVYSANPRNRTMEEKQDILAVRKDGSEVPVEVSLGSYKTDGRQFFIAFVSFIPGRKNAENTLKQLNTELEKIVTARTESLMETVRQLGEQIKEAKAKDAELQRVNNFLNESLEKEKELNQLKSRFVSMASHEFRTPLSAILSSAYLVSQYNDQAELQKREKHVQRIVSSATLLTGILNDFLSVGKIEEGKITEKKVDFNLEDHIMTIISEMDGLKKNKQKIAYHHTGNVIVQSDPILLKHIVLNLVSNAIKFSPADGEIVLQTSVSEKTLVLSVSDNGMGIPESDMQHLFERFYRGSNVSNIQGTGLGLHIVRKYAEVMNGSISCRSELNKGTEFSITIHL